MEKVILLLLMLVGRLGFADVSGTPSPTPATTPTPYIVAGKAITEHSVTYLLEDTGADTLYGKLADILEIAGALGSLTVVIENTGGGVFGFNLKNNGGMTSDSLGGKSYFYYVEKNDTYFWHGKGGTLTIIWWA